MACLSNYTLKGIAGSCEANLAGIKKAWLGYANDFAFDLEDATDQNIEKHTVGVSGTSSAATLHEYVFNKQTGSLTSTLTKDETNGTNYYTNTVTLQFTRMEQSKHLEIEAMAKEHLCGIILDNNGEYWLVGWDGYLSLDEDTTQTGQSYDDLNGYQLTLNAMSGYKPINVNKDYLDDMISAGTNV